jgi:hypothetical protein
VREETSYTIAFRVSPERLKELNDIAETLDPTEKGRKKRGVSVHDIARLLVYQSLDDTLRKQFLAGQESLGKQFLAGQEFLVSRLEEVSQAVEELSESVGKDFETLDKTITQKTGELGKLYRQK